MTVEIVISVIVGFGIGWFFAHRGSRELREEAGRLRHLNILILDAMEHAGLVELRREDGEIKGRIVQISATLGSGAVAADSAEATIRKAGESES